MGIKIKIALLVISKLFELSPSMVRMQMIMMMGVVMGSRSQADEDSKP